VAVQVICKQRKDVIGSRIIQFVFFAIHNNMRNTAVSLVHQSRASAHSSLKSSSVWQQQHARPMSAVAAAHAKPVDGFSGAVGNTPLVRIASQT
jgi:Na+-transporting NADH:ubiquinone oxidoreductase subunit NqrA